MDFIGLDKTVFIYLNSLGSDFWDPFWRSISFPMTWIPLYAVLLYFFYKKYPNKEFFLLLFILVCGILASDQLCNFFKHSIQRLRPCHDPSLQSIIRIVQCGGKYGFYSGHSSNSFFIAQFCAMLLFRKNNYKILLYFWASLVATSRVYLGVHFPLDILTGACMGILLGGFFAEIFRYSQRFLKPE